MTNTEDLKDVSSSIGNIGKQSAEIASLLKIMAHPQRLMILCFLSDKSQTVGELQKMCGISQSAVSQFLSRMKYEGLVDCKRKGSFISYFIVDEKVIKIIKALHLICCTDESEVCD